MARGAAALAALRSRAGSVARWLGVGVAAGVAIYAAQRALQGTSNASAADPRGTYQFPNDLEMHGNWMSLRAYQSTFMNNSAVANLAGVTGISTVLSLAGLGNNPISLGSIQNMAGTVNLPLPANLSNDLDPSYEEKSLKDLITGAAASSLSALTSASMQKAAGVAAGAGNIMAAANAKAINPMNVVLFTNINFRQYSYSWKLSPKNQAESGSIRNIVRYLQWASVPAYFGGGLLLEYPHYFMISIYKDGYLHKFQPAVIERINVNYHGSGAFYKRGEGNQNEPAPAEVELQISFKEVAIVTKDWLNQSGQGPG